MLFEKFVEASLLVRGRLSSRQGVVHLGSRWLLFVLLLQRLLSLVLLLLLERLEGLLLHHVDNRLLLLSRPANKLDTWEDGAWQLMIFKGYSRPIFIGPRSDHSLPMSVTHSLTDSLTDDLVED